LSPETLGVASVGFAPLVPWPWLIAGAMAALLLAGFAVYRRAPGAWLRLLLFAALALALANPSLIEESRRELPDLAVVLVDGSASQTLGERPAQAERALQQVTERLGKLEGIETRVVRAGGLGPAEASTTAPPDGTRLFDSLTRTLSDTPRERIAGTIVITDGQVHDVPKDFATASVAKSQLGGPLHVLLTGKRDERDRRLVVEQAPSYGIVGQPQQLTVNVDDGPGLGGTARVTVIRDGGAPQSHAVTVGRSQTIPFALDHAGPSIVELEVASGPAELTNQNNRAVVMVNGVRDRLRVLLVSGEPHNGERVWRNLLKADPSVDLLHFTILRPPEKQDGTPIRELSLIAFPTRELFEVKLDEFNLVIFDRYRRRGVLPNAYLENVNEYVKRGGAVLIAAGAEFASPLSLNRTPLMDILPAAPTGGTHLAGFLPRLSDAGKRHPVTADLPGARDEMPRWGRWLRMVDSDAVRGQVVMSGAGDRPLLILDRVGEGRVAMMLSDHAWLWARGYEGGGPQAELLRRLGHWMMKEPDLEENDLRASAEGNRLEIRRRSLEPNPPPVTVTSPSGGQDTVTLTDSPDGRATGTLVVRETGLYRLTDGKKSTIAAVGALNPKEFADVRATEAVLRPVAQATGGGVHWLGEDGVPELRRVRPGRDTQGRGWLGLVAYHQYLVTGVKQIPLLPGLAVLLLLLGLAATTWWKEGR
jgi:hypothetical protein